MGGLEKGLGLVGVNDVQFEISRHLFVDFTDGRFIRKVVLMFF